VSTLSEFFHPSTDGRNQVRIVNNNLFLMMILRYGEQGFPCSSYL
jgi:hypothetical protein